MGILCYIAREVHGLAKLGKVSHLAQAYADDIAEVVDEVQSDGDVKRRRAIVGLLQC
jgi:hypothetical protein